MSMTITAVLSTGRAIGSGRAGSIRVSGVGHRPSPFRERPRGVSGAGKTIARRRAIDQLVVERRRGAFCPDPVLIQKRLTNFRGSSRLAGPPCRLPASSLPVCGQRQGQHARPGRWGGSRRGPRRPGRTSGWRRSGASRTPGGPAATRCGPPRSSQCRVSRCARPGSTCQTTVTAPSGSDRAPYLTALVPSSWNTIDRARAALGVRATRRAGQHRAVQIGLQRLLQDLLEVGAPRRSGSAGRGPGPGP